ncbi:MAG: hypothetical protein H0T46_05965 [Deltaproteobacteria bacterium]|nr:hypothetical protein [Deltaproteobacteria bacterium]
MFESDEQSAERWHPLMKKGGCEQMALPLGTEGSYLLLECTAGEIGSRRLFNHDMVPEIRSLETSDMSWDDVERVLGEQMVFLPVFGLAPFLYTGPGFEPKTLVGGLDRLLAREFGSVLDLQLHTAARVAAYHRLAIEVRP